MRLRIFNALLLGVALSLAAQAQTQMSPTPTAPGAADKPAVTVTLSQFKVSKDANQAEKLEEAKSVRPDDIIEYRAVYKNVSSQPVRRLLADLPLPSGLEYIPVSAAPRKGVQFASAAGVFGAEPLKVRSVDGVEQLVAYSDYRRVRWTIDELAPGASTTVSARVKVESVRPLAANTATPTPTVKP
jgi:hypothetical protein